MERIAVVAEGPSALAAHLGATLPGAVRAGVAELAGLRPDVVVDLGGGGWPLHEAAVRAGARHLVLAARPAVVDAHLPALTAVCGRSGATGVACRLWSVYGEGDGDERPVTALAATALARLDPFPIRGDGSEVRGFTYAGDAAAAVALAATRPALAPLDVVDVGSATGATIDEVCCEVFAALRWWPAAIERHPGEATGPARRVADPTGALARWGWRATTPLHVGVARTVRALADSFTPDRLGWLGERLAG